MRVLGIDPGYDRLGISIMEHGTDRERIIHSECFETDKTASLPARLAALGAHVSGLIDTHAPDVIAIESLYFNKNQKTAMAVAEARGVLLFIAGGRAIEVFEYTPQQIKVAVTGHGQSTKKQVTDMVIRLTGFDDAGALDDEYDAIAVGITCLAHERGRIVSRS